MKILHVVRQYHPAVGGLESYVRSMAGRQRTRGHECAILTLDRVFHGDGTKLPARETIDGIPVRRVSFFGRQRFFIPRVAPSYFKKFDLIHVHNTDVFFDYVALIGLFTRKPVFATTHGGFFHTKNFSLIKTVYFNLVTRLSCLCYKAIFAISENDYKTFKGTNRNLVLLPNAIEPLGDYTASGSDFLYLGRLARHKNIAKLIETHAQLIKCQGVGATLHIVGPAWDVSIEELEQLAASLGISDRVRLHGLIANDALQVLLKQCGFFVSASLYEGFGMAMLEGMSIGLIPFVHPNASFVDLVGQAGVGQCVDFSDPQTAATEIAQGMKRITPEDRRTARAFAAKFSWDELTKNTLAIYAESVSV